MEASPSLRPQVFSLPRMVQRLMTRCECAGISFEEIAREIGSGQTSVDEVCGRTGCGQTCTACLDDLHSFLAFTRDSEGRR